MSFFKEKHHVFKTQLEFQKNHEFQLKNALILQQAKHTKNFKKRYKNLEKRT